MKKYHCSYEGKMYIKELNETALNSRSNYEKATNTFCSVPVFDTIDQCIEHLGNYSKITILPNGEAIIPGQINYPLQDDILKPVRFPIFEY